MKHVHLLEVVVKNDVRTPTEFQQWIYSDVNTFSYLRITKAMISITKVLCKDSFLHQKNKENI